MGTDTNEVNTIEIDLHGIRHEDVEEKISCMIERYYNEEKMVRVITGNSLEMKRRVKEVLNDYGIMVSPELNNVEMVFYT